MGLSWSKRKAFPFYPITAASSNSLAGRADHSVFMFMEILTMSFEGDERTNVIIYMCVYRRAREPSTYLSNIQPVGSRFIT